jgi:hypothetical protein
MAANYGKAGRQERKGTICSCGKAGLFSSTGNNPMSALIIKEKRHVGYAGLFAGILLILAGLALGVYLQRFSWVTPSFLAPGCYLAAEGIRYAGKPLLNLDARSIAFFHQRVRMVVPWSRVEFVALEGSSLYLKLVKNPNEFRIPLKQVRDRKVTELFELLHSLPVTLVTR